MPRSKSRRSRTKTCEGAGAGLVRCCRVHSRTLWPLTPETSTVLLCSAIELGPRSASLACVHPLLPGSSLSLLLCLLECSARDVLLRMLTPVYRRIVAVAVLVPPTSCLARSRCAHVPCQLGLPSAAGVKAPLRLLLAAPGTPVLSMTFLPRQSRSALAAQAPRWTQDAAMFMGAREQLGFSDSVWRTTPCSCYRPGDAAFSAAVPSGGDGGCTELMPT